MKTETHTLRLTETAEADLAEIWSYLASEASEAVATRFLSSITVRFSDVLLFPMSGALRSQLGPGLRAIFQHNYAIYYVPGDGEVVIVRVLHGSRDMDAIADQGGFLL
jgi:toxin ParE1/3/4